jgi:hypothetical protein
MKTNVGRKVIFIYNYILGDPKSLTNILNQTWWEGLLG